MKKFTTLGLGVLVLLVLSIYTANAQPPNDNVCDAMTLTLDGPAVTVSNIDASFEPGEGDLRPGLPLPASVDGGLCGPHGWCDAHMTHTLWFKFVAPQSTAVKIDVCGSTFDSQLALFEVDDCADFGTFRLLDAYDDILGCGIGAGFSARISSECLNPGQEYYVVVDDFQPLPDFPLDTGEVVIVITTEQAASPGVALEANPIVKDPVCPGGNRGLIDVELATGVRPISYQWSNGATTQDLLDGITGGTYTLTVTDFCQTSVVQTFDLIDPAEPEDLSFDSPAFQNGVVHPVHCGDDPFSGQIAAPMGSGVNPFTYAWSTGDTTGYIGNLADGAYTVTVTDGCGIKQIEQTFYIGASAGPDIEQEGDCEPVRLGIDFSDQGGEASKYTYNIEETPVNGVICGVNGFIGEFSLWRTWDLASDFGLTENIDMAGIEIYVRSIPNLDVDDGVPVQFIAYQSSSKVLDDDVVLTPLDTITTFMPGVDEFTPYVIPFEINDWDPSDILAVEVKIQDGVSNLDNHVFNFAFSDSTVLASSTGTFLSAPFCFLPEFYNDLRVFGFTGQLIMNMYVYEGRGLSYQWDGPVDDPTSPTPMAMGTSATIYNVTITDDACGTTFTDAVSVDCTTVGTNDPVPSTFSIQPNPSSGQFQLVNDGENRLINIQVFDLQGKLVFGDQQQFQQGDQYTLDLTTLPKGVYLAQLINEDSVESQKLIIQ